MSIIMRMLFESNAIENEWDVQSLEDAHQAWMYLKSYNTLDIGVVRDTHKILMQNKDISDKYIGGWRDVPVSIGGELKSQPKIVIDSLMRDFCNDVNNDVHSQAHDFGPIDFHIRFENIHPFIDGNGRMGRLLLNWHLLKLGEPFKVFYEEQKEEYYKLFRK